ncbi:MAG: tetratricopeptide repeat protein [Chloroflexota bacterium]
MTRLSAYVIRRFRAWDAPSRFALLSALGLLLVTLLVLAVGPENIRQPSLIGFVGLIIVIQIIFMWGNRGMITPFTRAQRYYLAEEFESARQVLENLNVNGKPDAQSLTLLGNTYRQLGMLDESEEVLTKALELRPLDHFPLYGIGRTLLVKGQYAQAAAKIKQALDAAAPLIVQFDLGEALYRLGKTDEAKLMLKAAADVAQEPHRTLMSQYLLYRLGAGQPPTSDLIASGLPYWQDNAIRFQETPYGQLLADDIQQMQAFIEER